MKRESSKNWRAKLISVLFVRLTLKNWRAKQRLEISCEIGLDKSRK